ncbi:amino acid permease [Purpureocillium lavendulum]|uniref:Amino acid permease n=1 Tax=Purpureocillium lavendulum TaxID=1247861 RepID=A0AB34FX50_9HYPO|nr:amino acid permease [Purpureocillium lavendulum]
MASQKTESSTASEVKQYEYGRGHGTDVDNLQSLGYKEELRRNRSMFTLLFQSLAVAAIPYGFGSTLISAVYGGGQLAMFLGWVVVCILDECIAISLAELAAKYPTSAGPYYWSYQIAGPRYKTVLSFITGWTWLIGNWTITLSVNFGFASLLAATVNLYQPTYEWQPWKLVLALCGYFLRSIHGHHYRGSLHLAVCGGEGGSTFGSIHPGHEDITLSGWGGFSFFIGILPPAYTFSALGMITSMAEECGDVTVKLPRAISLAVPVGFVAGLFFVIPLCATLPPLADILEAPLGQAIPYVFLRVLGSPSSALALTTLILVITVFCSISITVAASRTTWAFARDNAIPGSRLWSKVNETHTTPIWALTLTTLVQMLLSLIYLGSSSAFNAFVSVGVVALAVSYGIPIALSMSTGRAGVNTAPWTFGKTLGWIVNSVAVCWIAFELVLFSMPPAIPVTPSTMNYCIVVFVGFMTISAAWYGIHARHVESSIKFFDAAEEPAATSVEANFSAAVVPFDALFDVGDETLTDDTFPSAILEPWRAIDILPVQDSMQGPIHSPEWRPSPWSQGSSDLDGMSFPGGACGAMPRLPGRVHGGPEAIEALMTNWFDQVCPAWSAFDSALNPNRKIALEMMHSSAAVFNALRSMSASFLSARLPQLERPALEMLKTAAQSIVQEAAILRTKTVLDRIPTGLLFSLFCLGTSVCWLDAGRLGLPFLKEAKDLLSRLSSHAVAAGDDQLEVLAFFKKSLVYWEMLLSFVDDYETERVEHDYQTAHCREIQATKTDQYPHPWTGISTLTSRLFTRSIQLCRSYRRRVSRPSGSEVSIEAAMQEIQEAQKLEERLLEQDFSSVTPTNNTGDEKTPWMHLAYVAEAYQLASLLQLYLTFPDLVALRLQLTPGTGARSELSCDQWTIPLALRLTKLLEQIPPESGSRVIQPLLYICASTGLCYNLSSSSRRSSIRSDAGLCDAPPVTILGQGILGYIDQMQVREGSVTSGADDLSEVAVEIGVARSFILRRLDTLECTLQPRPIAVAKRLVKAIWAAYDDETRGCTSGHWLDIMEAQNLRSLFG